MAKVLVTGGAGFVGSHTVKAMTDEGHEVFVIDAFSQYISPPIMPLYVYNINYRFENLINDAEIIRCDTKNKDDIRRKITALKPMYIVHFAALPLANMAIEYSEEAFSTIVGGTVNLLEVLRDGDYLSKFVYISSSMVYGDFERVPVREDCRKEPKEIYGAMKLAGEYMVKAYSQRYGIPYTIIRPSAIYGPTDNNRRVVGIFVTDALQGRKIRAQNAENTKLDFTFVEDVANGLKQITFSEKSRNETFNITRGRSRSIKELVEIIVRLCPDTKIEYIEGESFRPNRGTLDIEKAKSVVGYSPKYDLEEGVVKYIDYLREALAVIKE